MDAPYLFAREIEYTSAGTSFALDSSFGSLRCATTLLGEFNVDNVLAVLAGLLGSGVDLRAATAALAQLRGALGAPRDLHARWPRYRRGGITHTPPDALDKALTVLRRHCRGKLTVVFGCGGDRDRGKRPQMGAIAARGADRIVLTDDNPRTEDGARIIADIEAGLAGHRATVIRDRRAAIEHALAAAGHRRRGAHRRQRS